MDHERLLEAERPDSVTHGQAQTPMSDHVARFWKYLETETVRIST